MKAPHAMNRLGISTTLCGVLFALSGGIVCYDFTGMHWGYGILLIVGMIPVIMRCFKRFIFDEAWLGMALMILFFLGGAFLAHVSDRKAILQDEVVTTIHPMLELAEGLRRDGTLCLSHYLSDERVRSVVSAVVLGDKSELSSSHRMLFSVAGASHLLAVSGLHVGMLAALLYFMMYGWKGKQARNPVWYKEIVVVMVLWGYAFIVGMTPSVVRTALMLSFWIVGRLLRRPQQAGHLLIIAALLLLVYDPWNLYNVSFQLSFSALFTILYLHEALRPFYSHFTPLIRYPIQLLGASCSAQLGTLPFILFYFKSFPLYFWLSNLLLIPICSLLLPLGFLLLLSSSFPFLAKIVAGLVTHLVGALFYVMEVTSSLPCALLHISHFSISSALLLGITLFAFSVWCVEKNKAGFYLLCFNSLLFFISIS